MAGRILQIALLRFDPECRRWFGGGNKAVIGVGCRSGVAQHLRNFFGFEYDFARIVIQQRGAAL